jgi:hypothetical protein
MSEDAGPLTFLDPCPFDGCDGVIVSVRWYEHGGYEFHKAGCNRGHFTTVTRPILRPVTVYGGRWS